MLRHATASAEANSRGEARAAPGRAAPASGASVRVRGCEPTTLLGPGPRARASDCAARGPGRAPGPPRPAGRRSIRAPVGSGRKFASGVPFGRQTRSAPLPTRTSASRMPWSASVARDAAGSNGAALAVRDQDRPPACGRCRGKKPCGRDLLQRVERRRDRVHLARRRILDRRAPRRSSRRPRGRTSGRGPAAPGR